MGSGRIEGRASPGRIFSWQMAVFARIVAGIMLVFSSAHAKEHQTAGTEYQLRRLYGDSGNYHFSGHVHRLGERQFASILRKRPNHHELESAIKNKFGDWSKYVIKEKPGANWRHLTKGMRKEEADKRGVLRAKARRVKAPTTSHLAQVNVQAWRVRSKRSAREQRKIRRQSRRIHRQSKQIKELQKSVHALTSRLHDMSGTIKRAMAAKKHATEKLTISRPAPLMELAKAEAAAKKHVFPKASKQRLALIRNNEAAYPTP